MQLKINRSYNHHENPEIAIHKGENNKKLIIGRLYKENDFIHSYQGQNSKSRQFLNLNARVIQNNEPYISIQQRLSTKIQKYFSYSKSASSSNNTAKQSKDLSLQFQTSWQTQNNNSHFKQFEKKFQIKYRTIKQERNQNVKLERSLLKQLYKLFPPNLHEKQMLSQKLQQCSNNLSNSKRRKTISIENQLVETAYFVDPKLNQNFHQIRENFEAKTFLEPHSKYKKQDYNHKSQTQSYQTAGNRLCQKVFNNNSRYLRESSKMKTKSLSQKYIYRYCLGKDSKEKKNSVPCSGQCSQAIQIKIKGKQYCDCRLRKSTSHLYSFWPKNEVNNEKIANSQSSSQRIELIRKQLHQVYNKRNQINNAPNFLKSYIKREQKNDSSKKNQRKKMDNESFYNQNPKYVQLKKPINYSHRLLLNRSNQTLI